MKECCVQDCELHARRARGELGFCEIHYQEIVGTQWVLINEFNCFWCKQPVFKNSIPGAERTYQECYLDGDEHNYKNYENVVPSCANCKNEREHAIEWKKKYEFLDPVFKPPKQSKRGW